MLLSLFRHYLHHFHRYLVSFLWFLSLPTCSTSQILERASMHPCNGAVTVPPGFRFHPTDEELLHYYLRKKVAFEAIDLDVIRVIDLNKLEPWDLKG